LQQLDPGAAAAYAILAAVSAWIAVLAYTRIAPMLRYNRVAARRRSAIDVAELAGIVVEEAGRIHSVVRELARLYGGRYETHVDMAGEAYNRLRHSLEELLDHLEELRLLGTRCVDTIDLYTAARDAYNSIRSALYDARSSVIELAGYANTLLIMAPLTVIASRPHRLLGAHATIEASLKATLDTLGEIERILHYNIIECIDLKIRLIILFMIHRL
jgi:hypothetical protein